MDNSDVFLNPRNNMLVTNIPFLHLLPGWFRDKFQQANRSLDKLVQKYYYDCKVLLITLKLIYAFTLYCQRG